MVDIQTPFMNRRRLVNIGGGAGASVDLNFNTSPQHCSSQDGSFIQDEDMHLILEFGGVFRTTTAADHSKNLASPSTLVNNLNRSALYHLDAIDLTPHGVKHSPGQNLLFDHRKSKAEPTYDAQFDADIVAQLDFDDFSAQRDMARLTFGAETEKPIDEDCNKPTLIDNNNDRRSRRNRMLQNSVEVSLFDLNRSNYGGGSLFSSGDDFSPEIEEFSSKFLSSQKSSYQPPGSAFKPAFISTDSLDLSALSLNEENLKQACATNKGDYMLTFDDNNIVMMTESGVGAMSCCSEIELQVQQGDDTFLAPASPEQNRQAPFSPIVLQNSPQNSCCTTQLDKSDTENCNITTWGRIKRSYERKSIDNLVPELLGVPPKCVSLPELKPWPPSNQLCRLYAGERMASGLQYAGLEEEQEQQQSPTVDHTVVGETTTATCTNTNGRLIREFQKRQEDNNVNHESGYVTGEMSTANPFLNTLQQQNQKTFNLQLHEEKYTTREQIETLQQETDSSTAAPLDYEYAEFYVNGRYVDMNHNEIGYTVPPTVIQQQHNDVPVDPPAKPPRTFTTLLEEKLLLQNNTNNNNVMNKVVGAEKIDKSSQTDNNVDRFNYSIPNQITVAGWAKDDESRNRNGLEFLRLPFEIPALGASLTPFLANFLGENESMTPKQEGNIVAKMYDRKDILAEVDHIPPADPPKLILKSKCEKFENVNLNGDAGGPNHVQDWDSLAALLPNNVVDACRFFKTNSQFLRNIDKPDYHHNRRQCDRTPSASSSNSEIYRKKRSRRYCRCKEDEFVENDTDVDCSSSPSNRLINVEVEFTASVQKQLTDEKLTSLKNLLNDIEEHCSEIQQNFKHNNINLVNCKDQNNQKQQHSLLGTLIFNSLCPTLELLVSEGLLQDKSLGDVMKSSRIVDIATRSICGMILNLRGAASDSRGGGQRGERSLQFAVFIDSLLSSRSLDVWLCDLISDRQLVAENYSKLSYIGLLSRACSARLFDRLLDTVAKLRHLPFDMLRLIDVEISTSTEKSTMSHPDHDDASPLFKSTNKKRAGVSNLVVLQQELRFVFRFPPTVCQRQHDEVGMTNDVITMKKLQRPKHIDFSPSTAYTNQSRIPSPSKRKIRLYKDVMVQNNDDDVIKCYSKPPTRGASVFKAKYEAAIKSPMVNYTQTTTSTKRDESAICPPTEKAYCSPGPITFDKIGKFAQFSTKSRIPTPKSFQLSKFSGGQ